MGRPGGSQVSHMGTLWPNALARVVHGDGVPAGGQAVGESHVPATEGAEVRVPVTLIIH